MNTSRMQSMSVSVNLVRRKSNFIKQYSLKKTDSNKIGLLPTHVTLYMCGHSIESPSRIRDPLGDICFANITDETRSFFRKQAFPKDQSRQDAFETIWQVGYAEKSTGWMPWH